MTEPRIWRGFQTNDVHNVCPSCGKDYGVSQAAADACCQERDRRRPDDDPWN